MPQIHADLVFNTLAGIAGKSDLPFGTEGVYRLDQTDGADADKIVLTAGRCVVFFCHMSYQPQIVADQPVPSSGVAIAHGGKGFLLLRRGEWPWKTAAFQMKRQIPDVCGSILQKNPQNRKHSLTSQSVQLYAEKQAKRTFGRVAGLPERIPIKKCCWDGEMLL